MALTKDNIIDNLVAKHGLVRREAKDFVDTFFDDIKDKVSNGERVRLVGTGTLALSKQQHRKKRNIVVDENTPVWRIPSFTTAAALRNRIQRKVSDEE